MAQESQAAKQKLVCSDCGREYQTPETLNRHRRNHIDTVSYDCQVCGASFKRKDLLNKHGRVHTNPRNRNQRACLRCSWLKLKCDSESPCSRCATNGKECIYRSDRNTVSPHDERSPSTSSTWTGSVTTPEDITAADDRSWTEGASMSPESQESTLYEAAWTDILRSADMNDDSSMDYRPEYAAQQQVSYEPNEAALSVRHDSGLLNAWSHTTYQPSRVPVNQTSQSFSVTLRRPSTVGSPLSESSQRASLDALPANRKAAVRDFVKEAFVLGFNSVEPRARIDFWAQSASMIERAFHLEPDRPHSSHALDRFLALYFQHFHPKWPLVWKRGVIRENLAPPLYLAMTAIGAAYGDAAAVSYHIEMSDALGQQLMQSCFDQHSTLDRVISLSQSLILLIASTLYFGRSEGLSICHYIIGVWIPICRKFSVFDETKDAQGFAVQDLIKRETRRRLGMTLLHLETSMNALLGSRPLLRSGELKLYLPVPDHIWLSEDSEDMQAYQKHNLRDTRQYTLAELVKVALEPAGQLPDLQPHELELLHHGLLHHIWSLPRQSRAFFRQLPAHVDIRSAQQVVRHAQLGDQATSSHPGQPSGAERSIHNQLASAIEALRRCRAASDRSKAIAYSIPDRTSLLSSSFMQGISAICLKVDILSLCKLARACCARTGTSPSSTGVAEAYTWANSEAALSSVDAACFLWARTADELAVPETMRAEFKVTTFVGLLYAAITVWVFSSCRREETSMRLDQYCASRAHTQHTDLHLRRANNERLLQSFAHLLFRIQPVRHRAQANTAVYHDIVSVLSHRPFPLPW